MRAAANEAGFDVDVNGKSVTALEIEYGALTVPDQLHRTFFYFRDPLPYDEMERQTASQFSDEYSDNPDVRDSHARLDALKSRIEQKMPDRVRHYRVNWDSTQKVVTGLEDFGKLVREDLWSALDEEMRAFAVPVTSDWREQERWLLEQFVEERSRDFIGREEATERAIEFAISEESSEKKVLCFTGEPGAGKSAFFAHLYRELQLQDVLLLANATGASPDSVQIDMVLQRWANEVSGLLDIQFRVPEDTDGKELDEAFANLLHHASRQKKIVLLVDAINQFSPSIRTSYVTWLQRLLPDNVRVIITSTRGTELEALESRTDSEIVVLGGMPAEECERVAQSLCRRYHRTPHTELIGVLLNKKGQDGQPVATNPLWLTLAVDELNLLDEDDFARAERDFDGTPEERLHQLLLSAAASFPTDVQGLYADILDRAGLVHGEALVKGFINLIAASRFGWRESDLRALMPIVSGEPWSDLRFASLRRSMRTHLAQWGMFVQWDFCHSQFREAVVSRDLSDADWCKRLHEIIADYLESLPHNDPMRESELMFHYIHADDKQRAARLYSDISLSANGLDSATKTLAEYTNKSTPAFPGWAVMFTKCDPNSGEVIDVIGIPPSYNIPELKWVMTLLEYAGDEDNLYYICHRIRMFLINTINNSHPIGVQRVILDAVLKFVSVHAADQDEDNKWGFEYCHCQTKLGDLLASFGDYIESIEAYKAANQVMDNITRRISTETPDIKESICRTNLKLFELYRKTEDIPNAKKCLKKANNNAMELVQVDADLFTPVTAHCLLIGAEIRSDAGNTDQALSLLVNVADYLSNRYIDSPHDCEVLNIVCDCYIKIGTILDERKDFTRSFEYFGKAKLLVDGVVTEQPYSRHWSNKQATVLNDMARAFVHAKDFISAWECLSRADKLANSLAQSDTGDVVTLMIDIEIAKTAIPIMYGIACETPNLVDKDYLAIMGSYCIQANADVCWEKYSTCWDIQGYNLLGNGNITGAEECHQKSIFFAQHPLKCEQAQPRRASILQIEHGVHQRWGCTYEKYGDLPKAVASFRDAVSLARCTHAEFPQERYWQEAVWSGFRRLADVFLTKGDLDEALVNYRKALSLLEELTGTSEASRSFEYWVCHSRIGDVLSRMGQIENSIASYSNAFELASGQSAGSPENMSWQRSTAVSLWNLSRAYESAPCIEQSTRCRQECLAVLRGLKERCAELDLWASKTLTELEAEFPNTGIRKEPSSHDSN